jgi:hypothetical protein
MSDQKDTGASKPDPKVKIILILNHLQSYIDMLRSRNKFRKRKKTGKKKSINATCVTKLRI